jgi:hypothetical protein
LGGKEMTGDNYNNMVFYGVDARGRIRQRNSKKNPIIANHGVVSINGDELPWSWKEFKQMEREAKLYKQFNDTMVGTYEGKDKEGNDIVRI